MEATSQRGRRELSGRTFLKSITVTQTSGEVTAEQGAQVRVQFELGGGLVDAFNRATWQEAYDLHDTSLRLLYWITIKRKGRLTGSKLAEPAKFLKKATLYWTRNPDLTDNVTNRIWAMVVDEDKIPHIFDSERKLREYLFRFDRRLLIPASSLDKAPAPLVAAIRLKWGRHSFIEKGEATGTSAPFTLKR
jgi:hypothetical protein